MAACGVDEAEDPPAPASSDTRPQEEVGPAAANDDFPDCGFVISPMGYVRCNRAGHNPERQIGLVGWKSDRKSMFANCHLHSTCSISVGVMRREVSLAYLADWLCQGRVAPDGATTAERKALGVEHRKLWARP